MIQKVLLYNMIIALFSMFFSCKYKQIDYNKIEKKINKDLIYDKIEYFVNVYDFDDEKKQIAFFNSNNPIPTIGDVESINIISDSLVEVKRLKGYEINDSLNFYFSQLIPDSLFNDDDFKYLAGKLLEKRYLYVRDNAGFPPETFPVYNMSLVTYNISSNSFALNIITKQQRNKDSGYKEYSRTGQEFVCVDSLVIALDKIPKMKNDSIHKICMDLVIQNKTGGCHWGVIVP